MRFYFIFFLLLFLTPAAQAQQPVAPDLSTYKTTREKLQAWAEHCDDILNIEDHAALMKAAKKGLYMTPPDYHAFLSLFNFYIGVSFDFIRQNDSVVFYLERSEKDAWICKHQKRIEESLMQLIIAYSEPGKIYKKAQILAELEKRVDTVKDSHRKSSIQSSLSAYYINVGEYEKGLSYRLQDIRGKRNYLSKGSHDDSINFGVALVNVAELYLTMKNPEKAEEYLSSSLVFIKDYQLGVATIHSDFIDTAFMNNNPDEALSHYKKLSDYLETGVEHICWVVFINANLAFAKYYLKKNDVPMALRYINRCRELESEYAGKLQSAQMDHAEGKAYLLQKKYALALKYLTRAEPISVDDRPEDYSALQKSLSEAYAALGNWKQAYHHFSIYSKVQDELLTERAKINLAKMEAQYQNKSKQPK